MKWGLGQAAATLGLLQDMNMKIQDVDRVEIHEDLLLQPLELLEEIKTKQAGIKKKKKKKKALTKRKSILMGLYFYWSSIRSNRNSSCGKCRNGY